LAERENTAAYLLQARAEKRTARLLAASGKDGKTFEVEVVSHELIYRADRVRLVVAQDISERRHLELQLRQSQKMEAVWPLGGRRCATTSTTL